MSYLNCKYSTEIMSWNSIFYYTELKWHFPVHDHTIHRESQTHMYLFEICYDFDELLEIIPASDRKTFLGTP